jgi:hypothetical protein
VYPHSLICCVLSSLCPLLSLPDYHRYAHMTPACSQRSILPVYLSPFVATRLTTFFPIRHEGRMSAGDRALPSFASAYFPSKLEWRPYRSSSEKSISGCVRQYKSTRWMASYFFIVLPVLNRLTGSSIIVLANFRLRRLKSSTLDPSSYP